MVRAACVHFSRFAHFASNVGHKSEVTRPRAPRPRPPPIKFQIVFSPPVGAALGSLLNAVSSCTCESHFLLFLKLALRIAFRAGGARLPFYEIMLLVEIVFVQRPGGSMELEVSHV